MEQTGAKEDEVMMDAADNASKAEAPQATRQLICPRGPSALIGQNRNRNDKNRKAVQALKLIQQSNGSLPRRQYPDNYRGPGPSNEIFDAMNDLDIKREGSGGGPGGGGGRQRQNYNPRKRRRGTDSLSP